jgi:CubicO group peptidase (beta-lactamase class C family)
MAFAQMHLAGGRNAAGAEVLLPELVADMQRPHADMENPTRRVDHIGLGWWLCDWGGRTVYGHDGTTFGQSCFLRVDPETKTAVALLTNGRSTATLAANLFQRAFGHLAGITIPLLRPPDTPIEVDSSLAVGVYERRAQQITVVATDSGLRASVKTRHAASAPTEIDLVALSSEAWAFQVEPSGPWTAWRFSALADGTRFVHDGLQITPKVQS